MTLCELCFKTALFSLRFQSAGGDK